jgi:hypothetical protein
VKWHVASFVFEALNVGQRVPLREEHDELKLASAQFISGGLLDIKGVADSINSL